MECSFKGLTIKSSSLARLKPTLDEEAILRVGGRISRAPISRDAANPMILPRKHHVTRIFIRFLHERNGNCGHEQVLALSREHCWILKGRTAIKEVLNGCIKCKKRTAVRQEQEMAFYHIKEIRSDNGTNFVGAERDIQDAIKQLDKTKLTSELATRGCNWVFHPPGASHMSGVWERLVRTVKRSLKAIVGKDLVNEEVLYTVFTEAERIANSRPLTRNPVSVNDDEPLTPNHFLNVRPAMNLPPEIISENDRYS